MFLLIPTLFVSALLYAVYIESDILLVTVGILTVILSCKDILKEM